MSSAQPTIANARPVPSSVPTQVSSVSGSAPGPAFAFAGLSSARPANVNFRYHPYMPSSQPRLPGLSRTDSLISGSAAGPVPGSAPRPVSALDFSTTPRPRPVPGPTTPAASGAVVSNRSSSPNAFFQNASALSCFGPPSAPYTPSPLGRRANSPEYFVSEMLLARPTGSSNVAQAGPSESSSLGQQMTHSDNSVMRDMQERHDRIVRDMREQHETEKEVWNRVIRMQQEQIAVLQRNRYESDS
ncbi:hypothetical protein PG993_010497 [Apiospora rasikravindrae]|uniref:Uncharacterized protein n=1 Tax=Apiospora rasikravindrae TaxID=990691 RepID=A0ABR1SMG4_9PEZI